MLRIERTRNMSLANEILTNPYIFKTITEDGSNYKYPSNSRNHIYLTSYVNDEPIGLVILHPDKYKNWQCHMHVLPQYRKGYAKEFGKICIEWISDNLNTKNIYASIPQLYLNVKKYAQSFGFRKIKSLPNSYRKNGRLMDVEVFKKTLEIPQ